MLPETSGELGTVVVAEFTGGTIHGSRDSFDERALLDQLVDPAV